MSFHSPWLLALLPLPLLVAIRIARAERVRPALRYPAAALLAGLPATGRARLARFLPYLRPLALLLVVIALARPQGVARESTTRVKGIDIVLAVDVSTSMLTEDPLPGGGRVSRIAAARQAVREFIRGRPDDRVALVAIAARPYAASPLTLDHGWLVETVDRLEAGMVEDGTALGDGLLAALNRVRDTGGRERVVVLLTDGRSNAGAALPLAAAEAARALGVKVHVVGIGSRSGAVYPVASPFGDTIYRPVAAEVDEETLGAIARATGGSYHRATDAEALREMYRRIDILEKRPAEVTVTVRHRELYLLFLLPALLLVSLELALRATVGQRVP